MAPLQVETKDAQSSSAETPADEGPLQFQILGVWTIMRDAKPPWRVPKFWEWKLDSKVLGSLFLIWRFFLDCISVGPWLVLIHLLSAFWAGAESAVGLYFSSRILDIIQGIILDRQANARPLIIAVLSRIAFTCCSCFVTRTAAEERSILATRVKYLFEARLIQANLRLDLPTFEEPETVSGINKLLGQEGPWNIFEDLISRLEGAIRVLSQVGFLISVLRSHPGGGLFAVLCIGKTFVDRFSIRSLWYEVSYVWDSNPHYRRMRTLVTMVRRTTSRMEILSNVLADYISEEWNKARKRLGDVSDDYPDVILELRRPFAAVCFETLSEDLPLIFYAYQVLLRPSSFSLTSVALMQQASTSLSYAMRGIMRSRYSLQQHFNEIKTLYESAHIPNKLQDGGLVYPRRDAEHSTGMEISFKNVSFAYPNSEVVIKDVSFTINSGQTVVIVGVNGSGKSTLLKMFNRLYDPTSGSVFVDGIPMRSLHTPDLRRASAMLFQNFSHFPLSIRENIYMGSPHARSKDGKGQYTQEKQVTEAARLGGSLGFVTDQRDGFDTVLQPEPSSYNMSGRRGSKAFREKIAEINKKADVSSGQWQRLALSRLFFRAATDEIRLVAVDEPSASLDPKMEYDLFESLRELSTAKGKTLVFVTHRFGYLTKRADLILVMEKGRLVEQGKHNELLMMGGEYAKLYNVQAEAFQQSGSVDQ